MATHFHENIEIQDQIKTADIIVDGKIVDIISTSIIEDNEDHKIVQTTYKVAVNDVISGDFEKKYLQLTIVGGEAEGYTTEKTVNLIRDQNYLMILGKDFGPGKKEDQFNPMYCSCFEIGKNDQLQCSSDVNKQLYTSKLVSDSKRLTLKDFKIGIKKFQKRIVDDAKVLQKMVPEEFKYANIQHQVLEMPHEETNGLRQSKIGVKRKD